MRKIITMVGTAVVAAALLAAAGTAAAQASVRLIVPNASPACGTQCFDLSSLVLGTGTIQNAYVAGDTGIGGKVGQKVNLRHATNTSPNEDFTGAQVGTLLDYCGNLISATSYVCVNYPTSYPVFESAWSPWGNQTGLCAGVAFADIPGENVTLQPCGQTARTMWVGDLAHSLTYQGHLYTPWVNASDPNYSHPLVLTVNTASSRPWNQLVLARLNLLNNHTVPDNQEFTLVAGPAI